MQQLFEYFLEITTYLERVFKNKQDDLFINLFAGLIIISGTYFFTILANRTTKSASGFWTGEITPSIDGVQVNEEKIFLKIAIYRRSRGQATGLIYFRRQIIEDSRVWIRVEGVESINSIKTIMPIFSRKFKIHVINEIMFALRRDEIWKKPEKTESNIFECELPSLLHRKQNTMIVNTLLPLTASKIPGQQNLYAMWSGELTSND